MSLLGSARSKTKRNCRSRPAPARPGRGLHRESPRDRVALAGARRPRPLPGTGLWRRPLATNPRLVDCPQKRWPKRWGAEKLRQLLAWNNTPPKLFARVNALRADAARLLEQWRSEGIEYDFVRRDWFEENLIFELKSHPPLATLPSFQQGLFYVQDPSTLLAVHELDPQPGESVLDLCAAPGGKTTYVAQLMQNRGRLVAEELNPIRLELLRANCARLGVACAE